MHGSGGAAKHGCVGAILTTFGVGELSALNGLAGAFSEHVPVVHIVGVPSTEQHRNKPMLHHTLGDGRYDAYLKAAKQVTFSHGAVFDINCAAVEIDRVLTDCITSARPVYLMLPTDRVFNKIPRARLDKPLQSHPKPNDPHTEEFVLREIQKLVEGAGSEVVILVDACAIRHDVTDETWDLIERTGFPVYAAPMGKAAVPEDYERYGGVRRLRLVLNLRSILMLSG
jgi:pyruvate decarboxylase